MSYSAQHKLSDEITVKCSALFIAHQGSIEGECTYPQPFGNAWVTVRISRMSLRFVWDRGTTIVQTRRADAWTDLDHEVIRLSGHNTKVVPLTWEQWCEFFLANYELLAKSLA